MKIDTLTPRTPEEEEELKNLKNKEILTDNEEARLFHLSIKDPWNCEC